MADELPALDLGLGWGINNNVALEVSLRCLPTSTLISIATLTAVISCSPSTVPRPCETPPPTEVNLERRQPADTRQGKSRVLGWMKSSFRNSDDRSESASADAAACANCRSRDAVFVHEVAEIFVRERELANGGSAHRRSNRDCSRIGTPRMTQTALSVVVQCLFNTQAMSHQNTDAETQQR